MRDKVGKVLLPISSLCSLCPLWLIPALCAGCAPTAYVHGANAPEPQPFVETVPGSTVTFTMRPVSLGDGRTVWFAETETTWDAYDVFALRLDENAGHVAAAGVEGPDAITRPTLPYAPVDRGWGHDGYPVISVTYNAARKYCEWLTQKTGRPYRLPTTAEWQAATTRGYCTPGEPPIVDEAWISENAGETTHPVAKARPNSKGMFDTFGNVAEWCTAADGKPVTHGGSFRTPLDDLERAFSQGDRQIPDWTANSPTFPPSRWWLPNAPHVGFRVVCDEPPG